jgi:drug/metabolite transporter (DMT)-like permease
MPAARECTAPAGTNPGGYWMSSFDAVRRSQYEPPEAVVNLSAGLLLGVVLMLVYGTHYFELERTPPELVFGFLGLYFYAAGYLSGRRTGKVGTGAWAGIACGLAFGIVVGVVMFTTPPTMMHASANYGGANNVAIAWSGGVFFIMLGAACGAAGARLAIQTAQRQMGRWS